MRMVLPLVLLLGCPSPGDDKPVDSDGDGLFDGQEADLGTDPGSEDSDLDGLHDGEEVDLGTDPLAEDTDEDGYWDAWEITEETDPTDADSVIYEGGWPYNPNKDALEDPGFGGTAAEGEMLPRFVYVDQFGQEVDIYDFAGQGKPVVIDLSGIWCYWCNELAKLAEGKRSALAGYGFDDLDVLIESEQFYFVTVLDADVSGRRVDEAEIVEWYEEYPNPYIPVLADKQQDLAGWIQPYGYPTLLIVDENMEVTVFDNQDYTAVLSAVVDEFGE